MVVHCVEKQTKKPWILWNLSFGFVITVCSCVTMCNTDRMRTVLLVSDIFLLCLFLFLFQMSSRGAFFLSTLAVCFVVCSLQIKDKKKLLCSHSARFMPKSSGPSQVGRPSTCYVYMCAFPHFVFLSKTKDIQWSFFRFLLSGGFHAVRERVCVFAFLFEDFEWLKHLTVLISTACTWSSPEHSPVADREEADGNNNEACNILQVQLFQQDFYPTGQICIFFVILSFSNFFQSKKKKLFVLLLNQAIGCKNDSLNVTLRLKKKMLYT